jgi:hypothetical protein
VGENPPDAVGATVVPDELRVKDFAANKRVGAVTVREKEEDPVPEPLVA